MKPFKDYTRLHLFHIKVEAKVLETNQLLPGIIVRVVLPIFTVYGSILSKLKSGWSEENGGGVVYLSRTLAHWWLLVN